jgi:hypothetical protein
MLLITLYLLLVSPYPLLIRCNSLIEKGDYGYVLVKRSIMTEKEDLIKKARHCCYTVVTLLSHGYTVVTLLLHCRRCSSRARASRSSGSTRCGATGRVTPPL